MYRATHNSSRNGSFETSVRISSGCTILGERKCYPQRGCLSTNLTDMLISVAPAFVYILFIARTGRTIRTEENGLVERVECSHRDFLSVHAPPIRLAISETTRLRASGCSRSFVLYNKRQAERGRGK